ncbi:alkaline phosphatase D family protein [Erythrobacter rubeus]|uniref:Alkaline phosphatase D family protein n=1 Tax=Erythrobacter rubeus TaxID=2760803 RepID=A0ABR8KY36_9SPHN|nr:alkaline phosphatase D family protein [Erythrobacter rubeus]MBD2843076.1 alkaline phosphatase D family protein [Erythrobacter rubeus]
MIKNEPAEQPARKSADLSRRSLFRLAGASAALGAAPAVARSFGTGFTHSVASGEPHADNVLLWTRYVGEAEAELEWQVAEDSDFTRVVSEGKATASPNRDWCAKAIANGLDPDSWYFYRFIAADGAMSDTGRTRTLPEGPTRSFKLAVFSCSNFGFGYFNAYGHAVEANDCDLAVHLGDYIYEYGAGTYPSAQQAHAMRTLRPDTEIVALTDYRLRYATYRADPDLQRLHQVLPMISVWDDHETANDSWTDGAQNHQPETEGDWDARKAAGKRAYREWMPVSDEPYAAYDVGDLATLIRLDTRLEGREEQFSLETILGGVSDADAAAAALVSFRDGDWADPDRQLLGAAQEQWLAMQLAASKARGATWQILAQQVLMGNLKTPPSIVSAISEEMPEFIRARLLAAALASQIGLPANMDAWDGYPAARARALTSALEADANLLVLAGDTHNGWAFELDDEGAKAGIEFGVPGVSSPGLETNLSAIPPQDFARAAVAANDQLKWADTSQRGYMAVEITPERATNEFRFLDTIKTRSTKLAGTTRISSEAGSRALTV